MYGYLCHSSLNFDIKSTRLYMCYCALPHIVFLMFLKDTVSVLNVIDSFGIDTLYADDTVL